MSKRSPIDTTEEQKAIETIGADFISSYYKDRYEEAKSTYRRLEDKVNYLLAILAVETSALLAVFGTVDFKSGLKSNWFLTLSILCAYLCFVCIVMCFFFLWRTWGLKDIPKMPIHKRKEEHDFLLYGDKIKTLRYHMFQYGKAVELIESLHKEKAVYARYLFEGIALSFGFFVLSVTFLLINKA